MVANSLTYYNSSYTFVWENGRQLATATVGSNTLSFTYNHDGIRTSKTVNGVLHNHTASDSLTLCEGGSIDKKTLNKNERGE